MWCFAPTSHTGAWARPTSTRNRPWVTVVLARYILPQGRACAALPNSRSQECRALWHSREYGGSTARPAASGKRFRASHRSPSAPATIHGTRPDHGPCGSMRSAQCDRRNRSCRPANPDRECSARPSWRQLTGPLPVLSNCPAGATFSQPSLRKSVGLILAIGWFLNGVSIEPTNAIDQQVRYLSYVISAAGWIIFTLALFLGIMISQLDVIIQELRQLRSVSIAPTGSQSVQSP